MVFSRQVNATFYRGLGTKLLPFFLSLGAFLAISVYSFFDFKSVWANPENFWLGIIFGFNALVFFFEGFGVGACNAGNYSNNQIEDRGTEPALHLVSQGLVR